MLPSNEVAQFGTQRCSNWRRSETLRLSAVWAATLLIIVPATPMADGLKGLRKASDSAQSVVRQAVASENAEALTSIFTENGSVVTPTGQTIRGKLTLRTMATLLMMTWGGGRLQVTRDSLMVRDSTGYEIGQFSFSRTPKNEPVQVWSGSYTVVWEREKLQWKVARASALMDRPAENRSKPDVR